MSGSEDVKELRQRLSKLGINMTMSNRSSPASSPEKGRAPMRLEAGSYWEGVVSADEYSLRLPCCWCCRVRQKLHLQQGWQGDLTMQNALWSQLPSLGMVYIYVLQMLLFC